MMPEQSRAKSPAEAAEAFYGLSETSFAEQLQQMGASDPRLIRAFQNTRERYLHRDS